MIKQLAAFRQAAWRDMRTDDGLVRARPGDLGYHERPPAKARRRSMVKSKADKNVTLIAVNTSVEGNIQFLSLIHI